MKKTFHFTTIVVFLLRCASLHAQISSVPPSSCNSCDGQVIIPSIRQAFGLTCPRYGQGSVSYSLYVDNVSPPAGYFSGSFDPAADSFTIQSLCIGDHQLALIADGFNGAGCIQNYSITVRVKSISAGADVKLCGNQSSTSLMGVSCNLNGNFTWSPASGLSDPHSLTPYVTAPGSYTLSVTENGVTQTDVVNVAASASAFSYTTSGNSLSLQMDNPACSNLGFMWDFGNGTVNATAQHPSTTFANPGLYTVCLKCIGSTNCVSCTNLSFPSNISGSVPVGFTALEVSSFDISVSPNPVREKAVIRSARYNGHMVLQVNSVSGKLIAEMPLNAEETIFNTQGLSSGIYFYSVKENGRLLKTGKLILNAE